MRRRYSLELSEEDYNDLKALIPHGMQGRCLTPAVKAVLRILRDKKKKRDFLGEAFANDDVRLEDFLK